MVWSGPVDSITQAEFNGQIGLNRSDSITQRTPPGHPLEERH